MARFDISGAASRQTGLETRVRDMAIRREIEPMGATRKEQPAPKPVQITQAYTAAPQETPTGVDDLPLPLQTVNWEGRRDASGNLSVYKLPAGDMGGNFEIAGINDRYHPEAFKAISALPAQDREEAAAEYIRSYTAPLVSQLPAPMRPFAQDLAFNRGLGGAARYIQQGLRELGQDIAVDGKLGPQTLAAIQNVQPRALMQATSNAQLQDEYQKAEIDPRRKKFIPGLENRIRNRFSILGNV